MKNYIPMLGLGLCLALMLMAGCEDKKEPAASAASSSSANTAAVDPPRETPPPAGAEVEAPAESEAAKARRAAQVTAGEAASAFKDAADLTFDETKTAAQMKAAAAKDDLKDFGQKADAAIEKAGVKAGAALQQAAEKTDAALQEAAQKADAALQRAAEKADGQLSDLASRASEALDLSEPASPAKGQSAGLTESFLINQKFVLKKINEADFVEGPGRPAPTIEFGEGFMVYGKVCNSFRGPGQLRNGRLTVKTLASTRMACVDDVLGPLEGRLLAMLENGVDISINGAFLTLSQGETGLVYEADASR